MTPSLTAPPPAMRLRQRRNRRVLLWSALFVLLLVALTLLVVLTVRHEASRVQDHVDALAGEAAAQVRSELLRVQQSVQALGASPARPWVDDAADLMRAQRAVLRVERRDVDWRVIEAVDSPFVPPLFAVLSRQDLEVETLATCAASRREATPGYSRSYFVPTAQGAGIEVVDLCLPLSSRGRADGAMVATVALTPLLEQSLAAEQMRRHELLFVEADGARLARAGMPRGMGVYVAERLVDLPGATTLRLRVNSAARPPSLIPNLATALVLGLSALLFALALVLARDVSRRARAEAALAEALAFRKAMEDSLSTGLRARDLAGRISYVNPAFCAMVGYTAQELRDSATPPYWPPELAENYSARQSQRQQAARAGVSREGFETRFVRRNGERFPVMIYEAPLVDGQGAHAGWMSAVLDISAQRRVEDLARAQQERLQATARLATIGEMASLLSHELNQPLAAIASYASGSLNLLEHDDADTPAQLRQALQQVATQAERAGRVIKSVQDFVRRREAQREAVAVTSLLDAVLPLVRMQARKSGTRIEVDDAEPGTCVVCDRTMVEQVLLNMARNGIQAMEDLADAGARVLRLRVRRTQERWVTFYVTDTGPGIGRELGARLFTPFFTTRREGMGLGLSLCRTVVEQHGGALDFDSPVPGSRSGTQFRFTLPAAAEPAETTVTTATEAGIQ